MIRRSLILTALALACLVWLPDVAQAQSSIAGVVRDTSGAVMPGVTVEASSDVLIEKTRTAVTDGEGAYRMQYALRQRAHDLGWNNADVEIIDADLGQSGAAAEHRLGFKDLIARVTLGEVGLILSSEVTRLARNCSDWHPLLELCGYRQCLIADGDGV